MATKQGNQDFFKEKMRLQPPPKFGCITSAKQIHVYFIYL